MINKFFELEHQYVHLQAQLSMCRTDENWKGHIVTPSEQARIVREMAEVKHQMETMEFKEALRYALAMLRRMPKTKDFYPVMPTDAVWVDANTRGEVVCVGIEDQAPQGWRVLAPGPELIDVCECYYKRP